MSRILALSSSRSGAGGYLETARPLIESFLGKGEVRGVFLPFASVDRNYREYGERVNAALSYRLRVAEEADAKERAQEAEVIFVGGGNTFKLLHDLYALGLLELIRRKIEDGIPYVGWSAGSNITSPTISTTNDMPIIQPRGFDALGFFPFQINPHYLNQKAEGFHGETRDQRLEEFINMNPGVPVVGLPEGTALRREGNKLAVLGGEPAVLFRTGDNGAVERLLLEPGADISYLL